MKTQKYFLLSAIALLIVVLTPFYCATAAGTAAINLSPLSGSYKTGQTFNVVVSVNPGSEKIDMVRVKLNFPADLLEIKSFSISPAFSYQAGSNSFDNAIGTFSWGAGTPGGITAASNFGTITFVAKKSGQTQISLSNDSLVLSAGVDKFNGQLSSSSFTLSSPPAAPSSSVVKKVQPVVKNKTVQQSAPAVEQPASENAIETQIITKNMPQNFAASLLNPLSFLTVMQSWLAVAIILVLLLLGFTFYKIIQKPMPSYKNDNKK